MERVKKVRVVSIIGIAMLIVAVFVVYALFTSKEEDTAKIYVGNLEVILQEDWPKDVPETGIERNNKKVWGESVADKKAYVRMRFIPVVNYQFVGTEDGVEISEWRTAPIPQEDIRVTIADNENWVKQGDYYYYKKILQPRETTDKLDVSWEVLELPSTLTKFENLRVDVRVLLEYSQTSNEVWKDIFQIDDLPAGVER
ncbi:MAG: hypothetical protein E7252_09450 [Lachnospira sp.]|nr:hypothetical protein [Lachnospira sp.]